MTFFPANGFVTVVLDASSANGNVSADAIGLAPDWASSGGVSQVEAEPPYQQGVQNTGFRSNPDVAFDADAASGVWVYDSYNFPGTPLIASVGGTSLSCPCWAGLVAIANQGRVAAGESTFNSESNPTQIMDALYSLPSVDFNQITVATTATVRIPRAATT